MHGCESNCLWRIRFTEQHWKDLFQMLFPVVCVSVHFLMEGSPMLALWASVLFRARSGQCCLRHRQRCLPLLSHFSNAPVSSSTVNLSVKPVQVPPQLLDRPLNIWPHCPPLTTAPNMSHFWKSMQYKTIMRKIKRINTVCVFHSIQLAFRSWRQKRTIRASGAHLSFFSCLFLRISLSVRPSLDLVEMFNACRMVKCCNQGQKRYLWSCRHPLLTRQMFTWGHSGLHIEPSDQQQSAHHRKISSTYFGRKMVACRPHDSSHPGYIFQFLASK